METPNYPTYALTVENEANLEDMLRRLEEKCENCKPLSPITCVTDCRTWRLKNQLRKIHEKMRRTDFTELLLNTLKNERRMLLLDLLSKKGLSTSQLQQKMSSLGYKHSQQTIAEEYVNPLIGVGLIQEGEKPYGLTVFGYRVNELVKNFRDLEGTLPPHSECYEEAALDSLLGGPKTYDGLRTVIPAKSVARVLSRLQKSTLVQTNKERNYIFLFRTRRNPGLSQLSATENRVYQNIPEEGVSAKKLSCKSGITLRRTYKYVRKLKGKKLVFARKKPLAYSLTSQGTRLAAMLRTLRDLTVETRETTARLLKDEGAGKTQKPKNHADERKDESFLNLTSRACPKTY